MSARVDGSVPQGEARYRRGHRRRPRRATVRWHRVTLPSALGLLEPTLVPRLFSLPRAPSSRGVARSSGRSPVRGGAMHRVHMGVFVLRLPCGRRFLPAEPLCRRESSPSHPQAVPDAVPSPELSRRRRRRALLCGCPDERRGPARVGAVLNLQPSSEGVLPGQLLERAIRAGYIDAGRFNIPDANVQPASLDLRLGERALRIRCSFLPGTDSVERKLKDYILDEIDLRGDGAMLEARCPYLIELKERLDLPAGLAGQGQPEELDRADRRLHPGHHRPQRPFRRGGAGLPRPPVPGGRARSRSPSVSART